MTDQQKTHKQSSGPVSLSLVVLIAFFVWAFITLEKRSVPSEPITPPTPILTVETQISSLLVSVRIINTVCEDDRKIDYSAVELNIDGGTPPYELTVTNSVSELFGPYVIISNNFPVRIKVYGGEFFTATVRSSIGEIWTGIISLPSEDEFCKVAPTFTSEPANTETIIDTLVPTNTETVTPSPTLTPRPTATDTKKPKPEKTNTGQSPHSTDTPVPTDTPEPTDKPEPTDTPHPTNTSVPPPTPTLINPHPRECEDGIDNDGDNLIDFGNDPQCNKTSDPHEDK